MPEEAEHGGGDNVPFYEQFVDMFTVTTEQQAVSHEDCLKVPPIDCSPGIEIYRASACVETFQRVPIDFSEDFPMIPYPKMDMYKYVPCDRLHDSPAAFTNGGPSDVPDKSVVAIDGVQQSGGPSTTATTNAIEPGHSDFPPLASSGDSAIYGVPDKSVEAIVGVQQPGAPSATATTDAIEPGHSDFPPLASSGDSAIYGVPDKSAVAIVGVRQPGAPPATATTNAIEPGHSDFPPLASSGDSAIYGVTDKPDTAVGGAPGAGFETPVHATGTMESEHSGLATQSHDGAPEKFSTTDKSVAAAGEIPCAAATSTGAIPPSSSGPKDPARPLTTAGISFRSVVGGAASRGPRSGN